MLFVVDDSSSMAPAQANLVASFPAFMETLRALPGGAPNLRIAVVSSDMGAGDGSIQGCAGVGKAGRFQFAARGPCTATNLQADATFITDAGGGVTNYTGSIEDVFGCIAPLGESGCGFEQPFAAITRALGADGSGNPPADNAGFLRPDARLAIVMLTNEDDCTPKAGTALFDATSNTTLASPLGPPDQLPLQRVRSPVQRRPAGARRAQRARRRHVHLRQLRARRRRGDARVRRGYRGADQKG